VNTYDPMDGIVYRHVDQQRALPSGAFLDASTLNPLPSGYPNASPRTYLGSSRRHTEAASPSGVTTSHVPPKSSTSWQSTSPGSSSA
jgi:hypothetical protein